MTGCVWITGATGFTGHHLVRYLRGLSEPLNIVGLERRAATGMPLDAFYEVDLNDLPALQLLAEKTPPDRVFHLAGLLPGAEESDLWKVNVGGTHNLLKALSQCDTRNSLRILSLGSAAEYLPSASKFIRESERCGGESPYGRTKWTQTVLALAAGEEWGLDVRVARPFNLLGPGLSSTLVAGSLCEQYRSPRRRTIEVGDLRPLRDFVDIRDAVAAYVAILQRGRKGQVYNVCSGRASTIRSLVGHFSALTENQKQIREESSRLRSGEISRVCGDPSRLIAIGWKKTISMRRSVEDMLQA